MKFEGGSLDAPCTSFTIRKIIIQVGDAAVVVALTTCFMEVVCHLKVEDKSLAPGWKSYIGSLEHCRYLHHTNHKP